jgi:hypothetical protein
VQRLKRGIERLRAAAARTPPHDPNSRKRMPGELEGALHALARPFYVECGESNKAKKAVWGLLTPLLAPWAAETTVKAKMQNLNSRLGGEYETERQRFRQLAAATSAPTFERWKHALSLAADYVCGCSRRQRGAPAVALHAGVVGAASCSL